MKEDSESYMEFIEKKGEEFDEKYNLPAISAKSDSQENFARDVRTKCIIQYETFKSQMPKESEDAFKNDLENKVSAQFWIDKSEYSGAKMLTGYLSDEEISNLKKIKKETKKTRIKNEKSKEEVIEEHKETVNRLKIRYQHEEIHAVIDNSNDLKITVTLSVETDKFSEIFNKYEFCKCGDMTWIRDIQINDIERQGVSSGIAMSLLNANVIVKVISEKPKQEWHDGILSLKDDRICLIAKTESIFKAFSKIGYREIYFNESDLNKLKEVIPKYDVIIDDSLQERFRN